MKRKTSLKTEGAAIGTGGRSSRSTARRRTDSKAGNNNRPPTNTYKLGKIDPPDVKSPFNLPIRKPGWFPDGADWNNVTGQRLFEDEVVGIKKNNAGKLTFRP